ncbi:carboxypeptidase regulatory-like domain-containing protein [Oceanithermus sp.]
MKLRFWIGTLLILALAACGQFTTPPVNISGYVVDMKAGEPVPGVTVTIVENGLTATTNDEGYYSIDTLRGRYTLTFTKDGYATSQVKGLLTLEEKTLYSTILRPVFDPNGTLEPPELNLEIPEWFEPGDEVTVKVSGQVADPEANGFQFLDVALGQQGGSSGYLNGFVRHERVFDFDGSEREITLSTTGYSDYVPVYAVAYDVNGNRTEVIGYIYRQPDDAAAAPAAPTGLVAQATTFGDVAVFGTLSIPGMTGSAIVEALKAQDVNRLAELAQAFEQAGGGAVTPQSSSLEKAITWVDLGWTYDPNADAPEAFEIFRKNGENGEFYRIGRIAADDALLDPDTGTYAFRDATPGAIPGVLLTYRVEAVNGKQRAASNEFSLTPLGPFYVEAVTPADNSTDVSVSPGYVISVQNSSTVNFLMAIVLDRVQVDGFNIEYISPVFAVPGADGEFHPFADYGFSGIPHGLFETDAGYGLSGETLQPFHAYDWQPFAVTAHINDDGFMDAVSIGADFFGIWGPFGVQDGPVNTFITGNGGF